MNFTPSMIRNDTSITHAIFGFDYVNVLSRDKYSLGRIKKSTNCRINFYLREKFPILYSIILGLYEI